MLSSLNFEINRPPVSSASPMAIRASLIVQLVKNWAAMQETLVRFLGEEDPWRRDRLPIPVFLGFPGVSDGK